MKNNCYVLNHFKDTVHETQTKADSWYLVFAFHPQRQKAPHYGAPPSGRLGGLPRDGRPSPPELNVGKAARTAKINVRHAGSNLLNFVFVFVQTIFCVQNRFLIQSKIIYALKNSSEKAS